MTESLIAKYNAHLRWKAVLRIVLGLFIYGLTYVFTYATVFFIAMEFSSRKFFDLDKEYIPIVVFVFLLVVTLEGIWLELKKIRHKRRDFWFPSGLIDPVSGGSYVVARKIAAVTSTVQSAAVLSEIVFCGPRSFVRAFTHWRSQVRLPAEMVQRVEACYAHLLALNDWVLIEDLRSRVRELDVLMEMGKVKVLKELGKIKAIPPGPGGF